MTLAGMLRPFRFPGTRYPWIKAGRVMPTVLPLPAGAQTNLLLDEDTVRNYLARYRAGGLGALQKDGYMGGLAHLDEAQMQALEAHLRKHTCLTVQEIVAYVQKRFGVTYTVVA
jgi:hypothetical protein